jgi:N4-gp56 family major capsid protein
MSNNTTINSELFQNLLVQSEIALYENSIARAVTTVYDYPVGAGKTVSVPFWDAITSSKPGEGVAPDRINTNTNSRTINLAEHVAFAEVTDFLRDSAQENVIASLAGQMGLALAEGLDRELLVGFFDTGANATAAGITNSIGDGNAVNTVNDLMKAAATIRAAKYQGPMFAVLHPQQAFEIKKAMTATNSFQNATSVADSVFSNYFVGQIAGITILEHPGVAVETVQAGKIAKGAVFTPTAFGLAQRGGVAMETERNAAKRSTDVVETVVAGVGILRPNLVVRVQGKVE